MGNTKNEKPTAKQFTQSEKAKRGWWASVVFMLLIVALIIFLSYVKIVEENRDILIGIIGMLTGSISSMLAIASGRDPSEMEELKEKLSSANADREALIARLRDAQIQMQLLREQIFELQNAVIEKLSLFVNEKPIRTKKESDILLPGVVEDWLPGKED
jgi:energy-converting hydrogenase Eha subunit A